MVEPMKALVKVIGKSGQISFGKEYAGRQVLVEEMAPGDWRVRTAVVVPESERWVHTPEMAPSLERALNWMRRTPRKSRICPSYVRRSDMVKAQHQAPVKLGLNNPEFQRRLLASDKSERNRVLNTLEKLLKMSWGQVYEDRGLNWEKIDTPPVRLQAGESVYSIRIRQARRAAVARRGDFMSFLTLPSDHDATYEQR